MILIWYRETIPPMADPTRDSPTIQRRRVRSALSPKRSSRLSCRASIRASPSVGSDGAPTARPVPLRPPPEPQGRAAAFSARPPPGADRLPATAPPPPRPLRGDPCPPSGRLATVDARAPVRFVGAHSAGPDPLPPGPSLVAGVGQ